MWTIALFGSNYYYEPDSLSEVSLTAMGFTDPMVDDSWKKFDVIASPVVREQLSDSHEMVGVISHTKAQKKIIKVELDDFLFPDDEHKREEIEDILKCRYIYYYKGTYDFTNWSPHSDGKCLMVAGTSQVENIYEDGVTRITLTLRAVNPLV